MNYSLYDTEKKYIFEKLPDDCLSHVCAGLDLNEVVNISGWTVMASAPIFLVTSIISRVFKHKSDSARSSGNESKAAKYDDLSTFFSANSIATAGIATVSACVFFVAARKQQWRRNHQCSF